MKIIEHFLDLLFPKKCIFCRKVLETTDICSDCLMKLPYTVGDSVMQRPDHIRACVSPLFYEGVVRDAILRYKFLGTNAYAHRLGLILAECVENSLDWNGIDMVSWVPLSKIRMRKRGYNQAQLLAEVVSEYLELPCGDTLIKTVNNQSQSSTGSAAERAKNVRGVYSVQSEGLIRGKTILLIDDVVTTGSTLSECAKTLHNAGASVIYAAAVARHRD